MAAQDMRRLFGGAERDISFDPIPGLNGAILPIPLPGDNLTDLAAKMKDLRIVVEKGHSLTVATGMKGAAFNTTDPEEKAIAEMSTVEEEMYKSWKQGARLNEFDKRTCVEPVTKWRGADHTLDKWLQGLQRMYGDDTLTRENCVWFAVNADFMVPTITAHLKVIAAARSLVDGGNRLTPQEMAEYQTARKILGEAAYRVQTIKREINKLTGEIGRAEEVIQTRVRHYQQKVGTKPRGEAPENRKRSRVGRPVLGAPTDLSGMTGGGREARRQRVNVAGGFSTAAAQPSGAGTAIAGPSNSGPARPNPGPSGSNTGGASPTYRPQSPTRADDGGDTAMRDPIN